MTKPMAQQNTRGISIEPQDGVSPKPRILIVDDEEGIVTILRDAFEGDGWIVHTAGDGIQALEVIAAEKFDVVLSDLHMPLLNGLELVSKVKERKLNENTRLCIISGHLDHENLKDITNHGISHVVVKPFAPRAVIKKIREACLLPNANPDGAPARLKMTFDTSIIRCVINAVQEVTAFYLQEPAQFGKPFVKMNAAGSGCLSAKIELSRYQVLGSVAFSCDPNFLKHLAASIFHDQCSELKSEMLRDLAGEICNQISGKIKMRLLENNYHIQIGLPQISMGKGHQIQHSVNGPVVNIPMTCKDCSFAIEFVMRGDLKASEEKVADKGLTQGMLMFE